MIIGCDKFLDFENVGCGKNNVYQGKKSNPPSFPEKLQLSEIF